MNLQVLNSRVIQDKKDRLRCAYRFHLEEQEAALDRLYYYAKNCRWISRNYQRNTPKGTCTNFKEVPIKCMTGIMITINSTKNLHRDLKEIYGVKFLMTSTTDTDALESCFNCLRGISIIYLGAITLLSFCLAYLKKFLPFWHIQLWSFQMYEKKIINGPFFMK